MNLKNKWVILSIIFAVTAALFSFQNCSSTSFSVADSSVAPGEQVNQPPPAAQNPFEFQSRTHSLFPEGTTSQTNQKVKAIFVIDNSATMNASQTNLSNRISALLNELQKYDSEIQIVSTTYSSRDCESGSINKPACRTSSLFTHIPNSQTDAGDGWWRYSSFHTPNTISTYVINSSQSAQQIQQVKDAIVNKIQSFGTDGSDIESPFAVALNQASTFFQNGDRGLIFILTDEDDTGSTYNLGETMSKSVESKSVINRQDVPGVYYSKYGKEYFYQYGRCNTYNEFNQYTGYYNIDLGQGQQFNTAAECNADIPNKPTCSLQCNAYRSIWSSHIVLEGRSPAEACASVQLFPGETMGPCTPGMVTLNLDTYETRNESTSYALGVPEAQINVAKSLSPAGSGVRDLYVSKFKSEVLSKLSGRYLISVMANIENQSCQMGTGQKKDEFFKSIQPQFPSANFKIASICANETSSEGIAKVAADFNYIANTKYDLNLLSNEQVVSAKLVLTSGVVDLVKNVDFRVDQGQFIILKPGIESFVRIDVQISKN